jgi:hypothetical protein
MPVVLPIPFLPSVENEPSTKFCPLEPSLVLGILVLPPLKFTEVWLLVLLATGLVDLCCLFLV